MKKVKFFAVMMLCIALLAFAGCGGNDKNGNMDEGTVTEETIENTDSSTTDNNGKTIGDEMEKDVDQAADDIERAMDGSDNARSTDKTTNR